jgi:hypothetical protein
MKARKTESFASTRHGDEFEDTAFASSKIRANELAILPSALAIEQARSSTAKSAMPYSP